MKTHCPSGHLYDASNTVTYSGARNCRTCKRESGRRNKQHRRGANAPASIA